MIWAISPSTNKTPQALDSLMLALGKSLYLACEFERKCQYVFRILRLNEVLQGSDNVEATFAAAAAAKDHLLGPTIDGMKKIRTVTPDEIDGLTRANSARNYIVHESGKIGSLHDIKATHIVECFKLLRPMVIDLAKGDNIISIWNLAIQEKQNAPVWMTQTYEARVLNWIFEEPFQGVSSWDEWTLAKLAQQQP